MFLLKDPCFTFRLIIHLSLIFAKCLKSDQGSLNLHVDCQMFSFVETTHFYIEFIVQFHQKSNDLAAREMALIMQHEGRISDSNTQVEAR